MTQKEDFQQREASRLPLADGHVISQHAEQVEIKMTQDQGAHMVFVVTVTAIGRCRRSVMTSLALGLRLCCPLRPHGESKGFSAASLLILNLLSSEP